MNIVERAWNKTMKVAREVTRRPWQVLEMDAEGGVVTYYYRTRDKARAHLNRVQGNPFLPGWEVWGYNLDTGKRFY